jgi:N-acetylglutamate synthase
MAGKVEIVPFGMKHFDAVIALWRKSEGVALGPDDAPSSICSYLARNRGMGSVATVGGRVVGAVMAGHDGRRGFIHHLAVDPTFRRRGLGRRLVDRCLRKLREAGIAKCHLFVMNRNKSGIAFWQKVGWTRRADISIMSMDLADKPRRRGKAREDNPCTC